MWLGLMDRSTFRDERDVRPNVGCTACSGSKSHDLETSDPAVKEAVSLRLDADVLAWLKKDGAGYQTRVNKMLRERMLAELEGR